MNKASVPRLQCQAVGTVIRRALPKLCGSCGAVSPFGIDYGARYIPNATAYKCEKCKAIEYVSATQPEILA
jgi:hypothetical protein